MLRLRGDGKNRIQNHHVIGKMVCTPGALPIVATVQIYSYHPSRMAYDALKCTRTASIQADKVYLVAKERGSGVGAALDWVSDFGGTIL